MCTPAPVHKLGKKMLDLLHNQMEEKAVVLLLSQISDTTNDLTLGYQSSDSASSSKFHHWPLLALLVVLVLHWGYSADLNFAILE